MTQPSSLFREVLSLFSKGLDDFPYRAHCVNYSGRCKDGHRFYSDVLAGYILDNNVSLFNPRMLPNPRHHLKQSFRNRHNDTAMKNSIEKATKKSEKMLARKWVYEQKKFPLFGTCFEYEINLISNAKTNIDLLTYDEKTLYLVELKGVMKNGVYTSPETLLRAALEITTYAQMLSYNKACFENQIAASQMTTRAFHQDGALLIEDIKKGILIPDRGPAFECWSHLKDGKEYENVRKFIEQNDIQVVVYNSKDYS
jgi:hypothetical protein